MKKEITQPFVTREQAVKLKEIGFDGLVRNYYYGSEPVPTESLQSPYNWNTWESDSSKNYFSAPKVIEAIDWVIQKGELPYTHVEFRYAFPAMAKAGLDDRSGWVFAAPGMHDKGFYKSKHEADSALLDYLLEKIIEDQRKYANARYPDDED